MEMMMTSSSEPSYPRILVGVDDSASSVAALHWGRLIRPRCLERA